MLDGRLHDYYDFSPEVVAAVADTAEWQDNLTFERLSSMYNVEDGPSIIRPSDNEKPLEILRFEPVVDYDERRANIYHLPMANNISPNMVMRSIRLFGASETTPLILVGNPGAPGKGTGKLTFSESLQVFREKDLRPIVNGLTQYLGGQGITMPTHLGYSYGADKAAAAVAASSDYDQSVLGGVFVEPASVVRRGFPELAIAFHKAGLHMDKYWNQTDCEAYKEIREQENAIGLAGYVLGLGRLSNLAIVSVLMGNGFRQRLEVAVSAQPEAKISIAWGDESELCDDVAMQEIAKDFEQTDAGKYRAIRIRGMRHAGGEDLDLHAAIMLEGLAV